MAGLIAADGLRDRVTSADIVVVPGNTVNPDGSLSPRLHARLDAALALYTAGHCHLLFVSGAIGKEGVDEAVAMKNYLLARGVPADRVIQDSAGFNTEATARNAAALMQQRQLKSALVASQFFHVTRTRELLERHGVTVAGHVHALYFEMRDVYSLARETVAVARLRLTGR